MATKIAEVILQKTGADVRRGYIVFTNHVGLQFYCSGSRVLDSGATAFGGFVSPVRPDKDTQTDASYYVNFYQNTNENSQAVLNVKLTKVKKVDGRNVFDEEACASGAMYDSGSPGVLTGLLFKVEEPEDEDEDEPAPPPKKVPTTKGKKPASSSKKPKPDDYDDIPF